MREYVTGSRSRPRDQDMAAISTQLSAQQQLAQQRVRVNLLTGIMERFEKAEAPSSWPIEYLPPGRAQQPGRKPLVHSPCWPRDAMKPLMLAQHRASFNCLGAMENTQRRPPRIASARAARHNSTVSTIQPPWHLSPCEPSALFFLSYPALSTRYIDPRTASPCPQPDQPSSTPPDEHTLPLVFAHK
ncbi:uncharacterized protein J3D65DRAFT_213697 [Phyllosticta citribraziliensis]|uniref:WW domain-containing protein n=1 Tax=Phyllosticta citribraziliensis TaxID=989973 RepID=A0ABR1M5S4_9PEZI